MSKCFKVGAGEAAVHFPIQAFPAGKPEFYTKVHDNLMIHIILIELETRVAIFAADMVNLPEAEGFISVLSEILGIESNNILLHVNHCLGAPHFNPSQDSAIYESFLNATRIACNKALSSIRPAKWGVGVGNTAVNINRILPKKDGYWQGTNANGYSDHSLYVIRFDDLSNQPIAILYIVNCPPGVMEGSCMKDGHREITADIAGSSATYIKQEYGPNVVAAYCAGATGDQWQILRSKRILYHANGSYSQPDLHEDGFFIVQLVGEMLAQDVLKVSEGIQCSNLTDFRLHRKYERFESVKRIQLEGGDALAPHSGISREADGYAQTEIAVLVLDDLVLLFVTPELQSRTVSDLIESSPYPHTALLGWSNSSSNSNGTYMMARDSYENGAYQSFKTCWNIGTAEKMSECILSYLNFIRKGK